MCYFFSWGAGLQKKKKKKKGWIINVLIFLDCLTYFWLWMETASLPVCEIQSCDTTVICVIELGLVCDGLKHYVCVGRCVRYILIPWSWDDLICEIHVLQGTRWVWFDLSSDMAVQHLTQNKASETDNPCVGPCTSLYICVTYCNRTHTKKVRTEKGGCLHGW